ncbi:MAG: hypothetical protein ACPLPR_01970 [Bacillota bacterium]
MRLRKTFVLVLAIAVALGISIVRQSAAFASTFPTLGFGFFQDGTSPWVLTLSVKNTGTSPASIGPSSQGSLQVYLYRDGSMVWYSSVSLNLQIAAGETKYIPITIPCQTPGLYYAQVYLLVQGGERLSVACTYSPIQYYCYDPLHYSVTFQSKAWPSGQRRVVITVRNDTGSDVYFPWQHSYEVVARSQDGRVIRKTVPSMSPTSLYEKVPAGATRYYFINMQELTAGSYTVEVWLKEGGMYVRQLATMQVSL